MKRILCLVAAASFAIGAAIPAEARTIKRKTYTVKIANAPVPCTAVCAYWMETANNEEAGIEFQACTDPFPTGSYTDIVMTAPNDANYLKIVAYPLIDWDLFVCAKPTRGNNGRQLAQGANSATDTDGCSFGAALGCIERISIKVREHRKYVLRSYNWSDVADMPVKVYWMRI